MQNLVIIGGGFAGMWAALVAAREAAQSPIQHSPSPSSRLTII